MMKHKSAVPLLLILVYAVLTLSLQAQSPDGALVGTVSDATNARVAGASVKLSAKGLSWTRFANNQQRRRIQNRIAASWRLRDYGGSQRFCDQDRFG